MEDSINSSNSNNSKDLKDLKSSQKEFVDGKGIKGQEGPLRGVSGLAISYRDPETIDNHGLGPPWALGASQELQERAPLEPPAVDVDSFCLLILGNHSHEVTLA